MDRATLATEILENLDDLGITFYSQEDVNESIKDSYDRVAVLTGCITRAISIPNIAEPYWNLKELVPDYLYPLGLYNHSTNKWLIPSTTQFFESLRWDWELEVGQPSFFCPIDFLRIAVSPHLTTVTGTLILVYRAVPPALSNSSQFLIPSQVQNVLLHYSLADLLEQSKEYKKAGVHWQAFLDLLIKAKDAIKNLAGPDKVRVMQPFMPLPLFGPGSTAGSGDQGMFIDNEIPAGTINGVNATFTLAHVPAPQNSLVLVRNGSVLYQGIGYTVSGSTITFNSDYIPQPVSSEDPTGTVLRCWYRVN